MTRERINEISGEVLDACIEVHRHLGPGLLESVYLFALGAELGMRNIWYEKHVALELFYKGFPTGKFYEMDLVVEDEIVVELKAVTQMLPVFDAQLLSYLKLANKKLGLLINFCAPRLIDGYKRIANNL